jgi:hypothetical protein
MNGISAALRQAQGERNEFIFEAKGVRRKKYRFAFTLIRGTNLDK